jgi:exodeoxyribonuclease VII large subunit
MFEVEVELNRKWSSISLTVVGIVAEYTLAKLKAQRDITNERLKKEGLFDKNKHKELPFLPTKLGIITSPTGTVINDFRNSLDKAKYGFELYWHKTSVQGAEARSGLIRAITSLDKIDSLDAILIFRGGGSVADLSIFNDYDVAKAICECRKPVIAAIGHQEDQCSVQDVSFLSLGVPKDIGHYFAEIVIAKRIALAQFAGEIRYGYSNIISVSQQVVVERAMSINALGRSILRNQGEIIRRLSVAIPRQSQILRKKSFQNFLKTALPISALAQQSWVMQQKEMARLSNIFSRWTSRLLEEKERAVSSLEKLFIGISPEVQLKRGFVLVRKLGSERPTAKGGDLRDGESVVLQFHDMDRGAIINDKASK